MLRARRIDGREDLDLARLELGPDRGQLLTLELVLERECLESALLDRATVFGLVEDSLNRYFEVDGAQFVSLPSL